MKRSQEHLTEPPARGLGRLQHDTAATAAELREFLGQMRGKSPQEVMGTIAGNSLIRSTLLATALILSSLLLGSTVTYFVTPEKTKTVKAKADSAGQAKAEAKSVDGKDSVKSDASADASEQTITSGDKTLDTLGVGETKIAAPDKNPLEDKFDDLLDKKIE